MTVVPVRCDQLVELLTYDQAIDAAAMLIEETAIAAALVVIHGRERALKMYVERGGHIRFDDDGNMVLLYDTARDWRTTEGATT